MILYDHQNKFIEDLRVALKKNKCVLGQAATGFGKTAVASFMVRHAIERGVRTYFVVHRIELLEQTSKTFARMNIPHGILKAGKHTDPQLPAQIMSIDTLRNRLSEVEKPGLMIVDECHHAGAKSWAKVHAWAAASGAFIIGLSATPWRLDRKGFEEQFADMVKGPKVAWLIENKYLSTYRIFAAPMKPDTEDVKIKGGDFDVNDLEKVMDKKILYGCAVENWIKLARGKKTLAFCPTIAVSEKLAQTFIESGIRAAHLDAKTPAKLRRQIITDFADGKWDVLSNVGLFGEGFDLSAMAGKEVPIEAVILYRPTMSLSLHLQQIGRALRPKPDAAIILDHASNCTRHGFPDDDFDWSLKERKKKKAKKKKEEDEEPDEPVKECPECHHLHKPAPCCPECGFVYPAKKPPANVDGNLKELKKAAAGKIRKKLSKGLFNKELEACKNIEDLKAMQRRNGYKSGFVWKIAREKGWR